MSTPCPRLNQLQCEHNPDPQLSLSAERLKTYFETGDIPTEEQFAREVEKIKFKQEFGPTQVSRRN